MEELRKHIESLRKKMLRVRPTGWVSFGYTSALDDVLAALVHPQPESNSANTGYGAKCFDCKAPYPFGLDLVLPDRQWDYIFPEGRGEGGGLLCPSCIAKRASKNPDSTVILAWIDRIDWAVPYH